MTTARGALPGLRAIVGMAGRRVPADTICLSSQIAGLPLLARGAVHEFFAASKQDAAAAAGFAGCVASLHGKQGAALLWVRHADKRAGVLYGHGLAALGMDPGCVIHLPVSNEKDALRAGLEGLRNNGLTCVILEIAGPARLLDLTATRRLSLAAAQSGITALIVRSGAQAGASTAQTRWLVAASPSASPGFELPGKPGFTLTLLKHRSAETGRTWDLEWDHETRQFAPKTLSRALAALSFDRTYPAAGAGSRTGTG